MNAELDFVIGLARQAGQLLLDHFEVRGTPANLKVDRSVVTESDLAADRLITAALKERDPDAIVVSEELHPSLDHSSAAIWVVDPLDGTTNFSLGLHFWGVSIARIQSGWPDIGVLYFPAMDELYTAQRGQGARLNDEPIQVRPLQAGQPAAFFSCCTRTHRQYTVKVPYKTRILGSAAYSFCTVARGSAVLAFEATPKLWDIAAGWLLVCEANGVVETLDGSAPFPLTSGKDYSQADFPTVAAATQGLLNQGRQQIQLRYPSAG